MNHPAFLCSCPQVKFNQALADHSMSDKPRLIDGIVLTKFDTIDDKVFFCFLSGFNHVMWSQRDLLIAVACGCFMTGKLTSLNIFIFSSLTGWCCHLHDLHHRPAHCVCGHGADLQRPAQPQRPRRGQCPDEGLSGCMFCCLFIVSTKPTIPLPRRPVRCSSLANLRL